MPTTLRCLIVEHQLGLEVLATAFTVAAGVAACRLHRPDLLILDLTLADGDGLAVLASLGHWSPGGSPPT